MQPNANANTSEALKTSVSRQSSSRPDIRAFQVFHDERYAGVNRLYALMLALLFACFAVVDLVFLPAHAADLLPARAIALLFAAGIVLSSLSQRFRAGYPILLMLFAIYAQAVFIVASQLADGRHAMVYQSALLLTVVFLCLLVRLRFQLTLLALIPLWYLLFFAGRLLPDFSTLQADGLIIGFTAFALTGLFASYRAEQETRRLFSQSLQLLAESERLTETQELVQQLTLNDAATGLANRRQFDRRLSEEWLRARRSRLPLALLLFRIDRFDAYRERYGEAAAATALQQAADLLSRSARRAADLLARFGDHEFALLAPDLKKEDASRIAADAVQQFQRLHLPHHDSPFAAVLTLHSGYCSLEPHKQSDVGQLMTAVADALAKAQHAGGNRALEANIDRTLNKANEVASD